MIRAALSRRWASPPPPARCRGCPSRGVPRARRPACRFGRPSRASDDAASPGAPGSARCRPRAAAPSEAFNPAKSWYGRVISSNRRASARRVSSYWVSRVEVVGAFEGHPAGDGGLSTRSARGERTRSPSPRARAATSVRRRPGRPPGVRLDIHRNLADALNRVDHEIGPGARGWPRKGGEVDQVPVAELHQRHREHPDPGIRSRSSRRPRRASPRRVVGTSSVSTPESLSRSQGYTLAGNSWSLTSTMSPGSSGSRGPRGRSPKPVLMVSPISSGLAPIRRAAGGGSARAFRTDRGPAAGTEPRAGG